MELIVSKFNKDTNKFEDEKVTIEGVKDPQLQPEWKEYTGRLVEREEKEIEFKSGGKGKQFIYKDEEDDRGAQLILETWSSTDDGIISQLMSDGKPVHLYYEIKKTNYGNKFTIKAVQLPDATWSVAKAKEAWKKGNVQNNRALAVQASAMLYMSGGKDQIDDVLATAEKFLDWIKADN